MRTTMVSMVAASAALTFVRLAGAGNDTSALSIFTSSACTRDEIKTLRDQVGCVDGQMPASSEERRSFDELAAHYLGEVDAGRMDENDARHQINVALRSRAAASSAAAVTSAAPQQKAETPLPRGYRRVMKNGKELFCRTDNSDFSRAVRLEVCLTKDEMLAAQAGDNSAENRARQAAGETMYGSPNSNASTPK
jgi:hypothetical protein